MGRKPINTRRQLLLGLAVSLIALVIIFLFVDIRQVGAELAAADKPLLAFSLLSTLAWLLVRAFAWRTLLQEKAPYRAVFFTLNEGYLLNNLLPFRLGEVGRAFLLSRKSPVKFMEVLTTILLERAFDILFAASLVLTLLPFLGGGLLDRSPLTTSHSLLPTSLAALLVCAGLSVLFWMARYPLLVSRGFEHLSRRIPLLQRLAARHLASFLEGLAVFKDVRRFARAVFWFLLNLAIALVQYYTVIRAFFPEAQWVWAAFSLGVSSIGWSLPSSPGGIGVFEGAMLVALAAFSSRTGHGLDSAKAVACGVVLHFWNYFYTTLLGAYALARDGESLASLYHRIRTP